MMNFQIKRNPQTTSPSVGKEKKATSSVQPLNTRWMSQQGAAKKASLKNTSNELNMSNYATEEKGLKIKPVSRWPSVSDPGQAKEPDLWERAQLLWEKGSIEQIPGECCRIMLCLFLPSYWLSWLFQQPTFLSLRGMLPDVHRAILSPLQTQLGRDWSLWVC